ncbi:Polypeptide N-acetylgalactosaminyltransferase 9 [Plecturocebus cupreus]
MEVLPCSRVAHIERTRKPYNNDIDYYAKRNALRAAEVWMDDFKSHVYMAWNIPMTNPGVDFGDVSERLALRQKLKCRSFKWYLENVYPEMRIYNNTLTYGEVRNSKASGYCLDQGAEDDDRAILYPCHGMSSQLVRYSADGLLQLGPLGSTAFLPDSKCLVDDGRGRTPALKKCEDVAQPAQRLWDFTQSGPIVSRATGRCLEVEMSKDANFGLRLVVQRPREGAGLSPAHTAGLQAALPKGGRLGQRHRLKHVPSPRHLLSGLLGRPPPLHVTRPPRKAARALPSTGFPRSGQPLSPPTET